MLYLSGSVRGGYVGPVMRTPNGGTRCDGFAWAADTGCFSQPRKYSDDRYLSWLEAQDLTDCLFATAPDVWGDGLATLEVARPVLPRIRALGIRAALVAQPGLTPDLVPWDEIDALFIGGPDDWHRSSTVRDLATEAKSRGVWLHEGRVNSWRRFERARALRCDSVDGTYLRYDPDLKSSPGPEGWMARAAREPHLWDIQ